METKRILTKTDRNGTKYWRIIETCPRCGGRGDYILGGLNYGTCFQCGGTRKHEYTFKEYTPEYEAKLEARRQAKAAKVAEERARYEAEHADEIEAENRRIIEARYADNGCGKDGIGYVLTGNTFPVKDQIRRNGGRWIYGRWICPVEVNGKDITAKRINLAGHIGSGSEIWLNGFDLWDAIEG